MSDPRVRTLLQFWQMHDTLPHEFCRDRIAPLIILRLEYLWVLKACEPHDDAIFLAKLQQAYDDMIVRNDLRYVWAWEYLAPTFDSLTAPSNPSIPVFERHLIYSVRGREPFHTLKICINRPRGELDALHEQALDTLWTATERPPTPGIVACPPVVDLRAHL